MKNLKGKTALVTGAASGIGLACAKELAREGAVLILNDVNGERLDDAAEECRRIGATTYAIQADLAKKPDITRLAKQALEQAGRVDLLYNNAGVMYLGPVKEMKLSDWEWIVDINLWGPVRLTHALLPHFLERKSGHIVTTASMAGLVGVPGLTAYSLTKFAMVGFSEALRAEIAGEGIDVSVVCPNIVESGITEIGHYASADAEKTAKKGMASGIAYPASKAAKDIVRGIKQNKGIITTAPGARPMWALKRISPEAMSRVNRFLWRRGKRDLS